MALGKRVEAARKAKKISQSQLASMINVSQVAISRIERDDMRPTVETLAKLSRALDVSMDSLTAIEQIAA